MPEGTTGGNGQAPTATSANGQAPTQGTPTAGNGQAPTGNTDPQYVFSAPDEATWKRVQSELAEARREAATYRKAKDDADAASMTDFQKLQKQHETVTTQAQAYRATIAQMAIQLEAQKLGIIDPEVAATLISSKLEYGENGSPTNAAELLKELAKTKPYLVSQQQAAATQQPPAATAGGATNPSRQATNGGAKPALSWPYIQQLQSTNTAEYLERRSEIQAWMQRNLASRPR